MALAEISQLTPPKHQKRCHVEALTASQTTQRGFATSDGPLGAYETMSRCNRVREDGRSASGEGPAPAGSALPHR